MNRLSSSNIRNLNRQFNELLITVNCYRIGYSSLSDSDRQGLNILESYLINSKSVIKSYFRIDDDENE